ncbi:T9SS type A sorting domain-containing protein [Flavobacterium piscis]|uniref:Secretion system C-terminal sorting domain-containing protein n=1 Tax=Flavobacterium piscis TaxID=1114874 RepID=A0ABU1YD61_9FLAO|nr:T9SS type A sorting domain-containing protein [Flavobacterium piscis]MDR7212098.1 hypothetical protein [Flavobacterium piscis]
MRKNYSYLLILLFLTISMLGQKVTLTPTLVNGVSFSSGSINLASVPNSTISLSVKVEVPSTTVGDQGTIKIYFSKGTALGSNIAIGGDGGALYFGGGKTATRNFTINLNWGDFSTSGGYIYAEYKNSTTVVYKSSNISVIKNSTMTSGTNLNPPADAPNPKNIVNTLCCNQTIRLGDKPAPIIGSQHLNPYEGKPYGINQRWSVNANNIVLSLDYINKILDLDYITELKDLTITRELGYLYGGEFPNKSNTVTIKVVPSPILKNEISIDTPINSEGYYEITDTNPKQISGTMYDSQVNLNILQDPFHIPKRGDSSANIEKFEWEYTKTNAGLGGIKNWTTISGENDYFLKSFNPSEISNTEDNYYLLRRIAIYQNIKRVSNTLKIVLRTIRLNNTICCDQKLNILSSEEIEKPSIIIGSTAVSDKNNILLYQWQQKRINNRESIDTWSDIQGASSKDYLPSALKYVLNSRGSSIQDYSYRRIARASHYGGETSYSNEISVSPSYDRPSSSSIIVYPNPATSIINIENKENVFSAIDTKISIVNISGIEVNSNNFTFTNPNLISINISNLISGTYFINIQTLVNGRRKLLQFTFIKS